jgi:CSLREA domain-containing protein
MTRFLVNPITTRVFRLVVLLALMAGPWALVAPAPTIAGGGQTFTVNSRADTDDGECEPFVFSPPANCTLREAINAANANAGADTIAFNIALAGVLTIEPTTQLPAITDPVTINGYTQPGATKNTLKQGTNAVLLIEISGNAAPAGAHGLLIEQGPATIRGLVINKFQENGGSGGSGISMPNVAGNTDNIIAGNFLGVDPTGALDEGNEVDGVQCFGLCGASRIGGPHPADRNLISGNGRNGVFLNADDSRVQGNLIGTDKFGSGDLGNDDEGVSVGGDNNLVVGNRIAFNGLAGVGVGGGTGHRISRNAIFDNTGFGIDLGEDGRTGNDAAPDADTGANNFQNFPELDAATTSSSGTTIKGKLKSTPRTTFIIEFFANAPGEDEGEKFIGKTTIETNGNGSASFTFHPKKKVAVGKTVTATATDEDGNTSEFSDPETVA